MCGAAGPGEFRMQIPDLTLQATDATSVRLRELLAGKPATVLALVRHFG
jgi:hypothetical protein